MSNSPVTTAPVTGATRPTVYIETGREGRMKRYELP